MSDHLTIVYPKNDRLAKGAQKAIYERFGFLVLSSPDVVQYYESFKENYIYACRKLPRETVTSNVPIYPPIKGDVYRVVRSRNGDVPATTEKIGNYGITTEDVIRNYRLERPDSSLVIDSYLNFGYCRVSILGEPSTTTAVVGKFKRPRVATKPSYKNLAIEYFKKQKIDAEIVTDWSGELEALPNLGLADFIVDSVETGRSKEENGLIEYDKIMDSRAIWIWIWANPY